MGKNLSNLVYELVIYEDSEFKKIFSYFESRGLLVFIFPWILTWFVYTFKSLRTVSRIWDYILCTGPQATIYLAAGLILSKKKELIAQCERFNVRNIISRKLKFMNSSSIRQRILNSMPNLQLRSLCCWKTRSNWMNLKDLETSIRSQSFEWKTFRKFYLFMKNFIEGEGMR